MRNRRSGAAEGKRNDQDLQCDRSVHCLNFPFHLLGQIRVLLVQVTIVSGFLSNPFESIHVFVSVGKGVRGSKLEYKPLVLGVKKIPNFLHNQQNKTKLKTSKVSLEIN